MAFVLADNVEETTTTTGTGTINLAGATTGNQTFVAGIGNGNSTRICIKDANGAWEISDSVITDASPDTASRTLIKSSTGSLLDLSAGTHTVYCDWDARFSQQAALYNVAGTDADTTMAVGQMYVVDMSAWATADRTYTLPAVAAVGDRIGILISAGDASHELIITAASGDTLNGIAGGTEWSRLFITGEVVVMRCIAASATWIVENDHRTRMKGVLRLSTDTDFVSAADTYYYPTDESGAWTADVDVGGITTTSNGRITARRACNAMITVAGLARVNMVDQKYMAISGEKNASGVNSIIAYSVAASAGAGMRVNASRPSIVFAVDDYIRLRYAYEMANQGLYSAAGQETMIAFQEVF